MRKYEQKGDIYQIIQPYITTEYIFQNLISKGKFFQTLFYTFY